jgi:hypothetical protein
MSFIGSIPIIGSYLVAASNAVREIIPETIADYTAIAINALRANLLVADTPVTASSISDLAVTSEISALAQERIRPFHVVVREWAGDNRDRIDAAIRIIDCGCQVGESLNLSDLNLTSLPDVFNYQGFQRLRHLNLKDNHLEVLPDSFGNLQGLADLYLCGNQLQVLPDSFGNLTTLYMLYLQGNPLTVLPRSFRHLAGLRCLYLTEANFPPLTFLRSLDLRYHNIYRVDVGGELPRKASAG